MASVVNVKKLNKIRNNYPTIWKWMQDKASWEHITMGAVLNNYEEYIDELIKVIKQMNVDKLCKDCLNYHKCIEDGYVDQDGIPVKLKDRLYSLFVEGYDCFVRRFEDEEIRCETIYGKSVYASTLSKSDL